MHDRFGRNNLFRFRVSVGHTSVDVDAVDTDDAIRQARRRFVDEHPRMWDVIYKLETDRFRVEATPPMRGTTLPSPHSTSQDASEKTTH